MATLELTVSLIIVGLNQVTRAIIRVRHALLLADPGQDRQIFLSSRVGHLHLVPDATEERLVAQLRRGDVRREDEQHLEEQIDGVAGVEREAIHALLHRHDPAVEQLSRLH